MFFKKNKQKPKHSGCTCSEDVDQSCMLHAAVRVEWVGNLHPNVCLIASAWAPVIVAGSCLLSSRQPGECLRFSFTFCALAWAGFLAFSGYCLVHEIGVFAGQVHNRVQPLLVF